MVLITGATGTNGIEIVKLLSRLGVPCRAFKRNPQKAGILADLPGVEIAQGDLARPESLAPVLLAIDKALLCSSIGPELPEVQGNFVQAAKRAGVRYIVKFSRRCGLGLCGAYTVRVDGEARRSLAIVALK